MAFMVGSLMVLVASAIIWSMLNVSHTTLAHEAEERPETGVAL